MNAIGEKHVARLALRKCQRCGRPLLSDPGQFSRLLDWTVQTGSEMFCHYRSTDSPQMFVCGGCLETEERHRGSSARGKTK